jgi:hypothetical protein
MPTHSPTQVKETKKPSYVASLTKMQWKARPRKKEARPKLTSPRQETHHPVTGGHAGRKERTNALRGTSLLLHLPWHPRPAKQRIF